MEVERAVDEEDDDPAATADALREVARARPSPLVPGPARGPTSDRGPGRLAVWEHLQAPASAFGKLALDYTVLTLATAIAAVWAVEPRVTTLDAVLIAFFPPTVTFALALKGSYRDDFRAVALDKLGHVLTACSISAVAVLGLHEALFSGLSAGARVLGAWIFAVAFLGCATVVTTVGQRRVRAGGRGAPTLILGSGQVGAHVGQRLLSHPEYGLRPVGYLDVERPGEEHVVAEVPFLGSFQDLEQIVTRHRIEHAIVAFSTMRDRDTVQRIKECEALGVRVTVVPRFFDVVNRRARFEFVGGLPMVRTEPVVASGWRYNLKHVLDRLIAGFLALATMPLFLVIALAVKLSGPGPVLYSQRRVGRDGREFDLLKFRSMRVEPFDFSTFRPGADLAPGGVEGVDRRTTVGRFLRNTSLDELPQLLNVLRGDMSLVGPRPERPEFVLLFRERMPRYQDRLRVKAGITGWAQVHGLRGQTSLTDRIEWDNYYIENWSLLLDLKILVLTLLAILKPQER
jgi:exopolysaccharide biosynthesis polyprenyl glycosylphosphotransferase